MSKSIHHAILFYFVLIVANGANMKFIFICNLAGLENKSLRPKWIQHNLSAINYVVWVYHDVMKSFSFYLGSGKKICFLFNELRNSERNKATLVPDSSHNLRSSYNIINLILLLKIEGYYINCVFIRVIIFLNKIWIITNNSLLYSIFFQL